MYMGSVNRWIDSILCFILCMKFKEMYSLKHMLLCDIQKAREWNYEEMFAATKESLNHCQCLYVFGL